MRAKSDGRAAAVEALVQRCRRILRVDNRDGEPRARAGGAEQQPGKPAAGDQELDILAHRCRMEPGPQTVQICRAKGCGRKAMQR